MTSADRILITGAGGFLGSHIAARARARGYETVATLHTPRSDSIAMDIRDASAVAAAFTAVAPTIVINCAAYGVDYAHQDFSSALAVNVHGALCVLDAAARCGVRRFVHIGSCAEYGSQPGLIAEEAKLAPTASYGATKAAATLLLLERARTLGVPSVVGRAFGMWGPAEAAYRLVPQIVAACLSGSRLDLTPCDVIRDYTYVEDIADDFLALALVADFPAGQIVNVGSGESVLLREFVLTIASCLHGEHLMNFGALAHRPTEMPSLVADVTRLHRLLGIRQRTSIPAGIERTIACYKRGERALVA